MNWEAMGAVGEILGALAVVISLGYVAVQIRQSTETARSASAQNLVTMATNANLLLASDSELSAIMQKGLYDRDSLTEYEQFRFNTFLIGVYMQYDFAYYQFLGGQLEPKTWIRMELEIVLYLSMPGGAVWWAQDKSRLSPEFVEFIDAKLTDFELPTIIPTLGIRNGDTNA